MSTPAWISQEDRGLLPSKSLHARDKPSAKREELSWHRSCFPALHILELDIHQSQHVGLLSPRRMKTLPHPGPPPTVGEGKVGGIFAAGYTEGLWPRGHEVLGTFFQSARNFSSPRSVRGCLSSCRRTAGGMVQTWAPAMAASTKCRGFRRLAASTLVG